MDETNMDHLVQLEEGTILRYNPERKLYEIINTEVADGSTVDVEVRGSSEGPEELATGLSEKSQQRIKNWNYSSTSMLIELVIKYDQEFQKCLKKVVWAKIAKTLSEHQNSLFTYQQCDTKWKGLVETYKNVKKHNNTSGNDRKQWTFFEEMDRALAKKPEINPVATCSSFKGLLIRNNENLETPSDSDSVTTPTYQNAVSNKRKASEAITERRHKEKIARQDRFLELFEELVSSIKSNQK